MVKFTIKMLLKFPKKTTLKYITIQKVEFQVITVIKKFPKKQFYLNLIYVIIAI